MQHSLIAAVLIAFALLPPLSIGAECQVDFQRFLFDFQSSRGYQRRHIRYPLRYEEPGRGDCHPDCPTESRRLNRATVKTLEEAIYPLLETQRKRDLETKVTVKGPAARVEVYLPDSDAYSFEFHFSRVRGCWGLSRVVDSSL